jgi:uncharacterized membrane protein YbhN (UPF0104 family)
LRVLRFGALALIVVGLAVFVRRLDLGTLASVLRRADWTLIAAAVGVGLVGMISRASFWWLALSPLGPFSLPDAVRLAFGALAGNLLVPGGFAGDAFRVWHLRERFGIRPVASLVTLGLEKATDSTLLFTLTALLPYLWSGGLPPQIRWLLQILPVVAGIAAIAVLLGVRRFRGALARWRGELVLLRSPARATLGLLALVGARAMELAQISLVLAALGLPSRPEVALLVLVCVNVATSLPVSPGNVGTHEAGSLAALSLAGVAAPQALAFAALCHVVQTGPLILGGLPDLRSIWTAGRMNGPPEPSSSRP